MEDEKKLLCTIRLRSLAILDSNDEITATDLSEEASLTLPFWMSELGAPHLAITEDEAEELTRDLPRKQLYGRACRAFFLTQIGLPSPETKPNRVGAVRWKAGLQVGASGRPITYEAYPLLGRVLIVGRTRSSDRPVDDAATVHSQEFSWPEKAVAVFEGGRITSAEYRASIDDRAMVVRIFESQPKPTREDALNP